MACKIVALFLLAFFASPIAVYAIRPQLSVNLFESRPAMSRIEIESPVEILRPITRRIISKNFKLVLRANGASVAVFTTSERSSGKENPIARGTAVWLRGLTPRGTRIRLSPDTVRSYKGTIIVSSIGNAIKGDKLAVRNQLQTEDYVVSVIGSETQPNWPTEALKAQAVLTQTRLTRLKPSEEFGDSTQKEAYLGSEYERPGIREAVKSVWGKVLQFSNSPVSCFYHSCCAGATSNATDVFGDSAKSMVYLKGVKCDFCKASNFWKPTKTKVAAKKFESAFGLKLPEVINRDAAGRPTKVATSKGNETSGYQFWIKLGQTFGWDKAPGTRFGLQKIGGSVFIQSTGAGHGVGLCQWGAAGLAKKGKTYEEILKFYYPGTTLSSP